MRKYYTIMLVLVVSISAKAQLNESDSVRWQARFNATGSILDGNVARTSLLHRLEITHANTKWGLSTRNDYQYGTTRHILTESDVISSNFIYLKPLS
ncbi:MAG: hypothetical protein ACK5WF_18100, partial [Cyclobacteriaceae bacterium]